MVSGRQTGLLFIPVLMALATFLALLPGDALAKELYWEEYNTTIELRPDGTMAITEDQLINFTDGIFTQGWATIPLGKVEDITNVQLFENGQPMVRGVTGPGGYTVNTYGGEVEILWWFEPAQQETRHYTIKYDVIGGVRVYDDVGREQIWWRVVDTDFSADIASASATVILPEPVSEDALTIGTYTSGFNEADVGVQFFAPNAVRWTTSNLKQGDAFEVRVEFPKMTSATEPSWQAAAEAKEERDAKLAPYKALANLLLLGSGLLLVIGGPIGMVVLWNTTGRDAPVAMPIDVLRAPPDDLPPGTVGTLIDERADFRDMIATLVDLAERGVIHIEEFDKSRFGIIKDRDWKLRYIDPDRQLRMSERQVIWAVFGSSGDTEVELSDIRPQFSKSVKNVRTAMYGELVAQGYFPHNPETIRNRWRTAGIVGLVVAIGGGIFFWSMFAAWAPFAVVVVIGLATSMISVIALSSAMPRKTEKGAEAAERWKAFKRYLEEIERFDDMSTARDLFSLYLPYAVAFGIEKSWTRKFARLGTPAPAWYGPYYGQRGYPYGQYAPSSGGGGFDAPSLQDVSTGMGTSLQSMSDGLFDMFDEASKAFKPISSSGSSGGFSGGGGSYGGGGGGGGRGFS